MKLTVLPLTNVSFCKPTFDRMDWTMSLQLRLLTIILVLKHSFLYLSLLYCPFANFHVAQSEKLKKYHGVLLFETSSHFTAVYSCIWESEKSKYAQIRSRTLNECFMYGMPLRVTNILCLLYCVMDVNIGLRIYLNSSLLRHVKWRGLWAKNWINKNNVLYIACSI